MESIPNPRESIHAHLCSACNTSIHNDYLLYGLWFCTVRYYEDEQNHTTLLGFSASKDTYHREES
jgi:hypothetical protein